MRAGFTTVDFSEFEPSGKILVQDFESFTFFASGDTKENLYISQTTEGDRVSGTTGSAALVPLIVSNVANVDLNLGDRSDDVVAYSYSAGMRWTVNAGAGNDRLQVGRITGDLDWLQSNSEMGFRFFGDGGDDDRILVYNSYSNESTRHTFTAPTEDQPAGIRRDGRGLAARLW